MPLITGLYCLFSSILIIVDEEGKRERLVRASVLRDGSKGDSPLYNSPSHFSPPPYSRHNDDYDRTAAVETPPPADQPQPDLWRSPACPEAKMGPKTPGRKEKMALKAAQLEAQKREQEEKEEKERQEQEGLHQLELARQAKRRREEQEIFEKSVRDEILQGTCDFFNELIDKNFEHRLTMRGYEEWERYLTCDRLPYPNEVPSMNTYLYMWQEVDEMGRMENVFEKNETILRLLNLLENYIDEPLDASERKLDNWKEVRENYRKELKNKMDLACFHMIRDIEELFECINYWESEFEKSSSNIYLHMWAWMVKTVATSQTRTAPSKTFSKVHVKLPASYSKSLLVLRVLHTTYDHFSDQSRTWGEPKNPVDHDLYDETNMWHGIKVDLIRENYLSLREAEEVPCWFEIPEEYLYLEIEKEFEVSEESGLASQRTDQSDGRDEKLSLLSLLGPLTQKSEKQVRPREQEADPKIVEEEATETKNQEETSEECKKQEEAESYVPSTSQMSKKKIYVAKFPVEGRPEYFRITSEGEIDVIKTTGNYDLSLNPNDCTNEREFLDWVDLRKPVEIDMSNFLLEAYYSCNNDEYLRNLGRPCRTLVELLKKAEPRTGGLGTLNLSEETRKILGKMLGITIKAEKRKLTEDDSDQEKIYKPLKRLMEEAQSRYLGEYKKKLKVTVGENELNLRKYSVLGGVYHVDLIHQVPQPHRQRDGTTIQINYGEYNISKEDFYFKYIPPMITEEEENEEDDGKQKVDDDIDKLIYVEITVSENVLWFETPSPYLWDEEKKLWTSDNIYDARFNEEKQMVSFRMGRTCPIGIATFRFHNLPFQTWEIRPSADWKESKSIVFSLTASTVIVEYLIEADRVSLTQIQNVTALDAVLGVPFQPNQLIRQMRQAGLDLFPGWDSFLYVEGNSAKRKVLEEHCYLSMAMFAPSYQYTWSRWNLPAGPDRLVFQARECLKPKEAGSYGMTMATSHRARFVACTEVSPQFSEEPANKELPYQPDIFNLLENTASEKAKKRAKKTSQDLVFTLYYMLAQTKLLSFS